MALLPGAHSSLPLDVCHLSLCVAKSVQSHLSPAAHLQVFKVVEAKRVVTWHFYFTKIMPIGLFMAATLHFGNLVYLYLTVSFIQMLKV